MPFKSEKQRRLLWAKHPTIAKRWAHEYPESNKGLPMYAADKSEEAQKAAALVITRVLNKFRAKKSFAVPVIVNTRSIKAANDKLEYVEIPHSDAPTYAGEEREQGDFHGNESAQPRRTGVISSILDDMQPEESDEGQKVADSPLLRKLAAVLAQPLRSAIEEEQARLEGREPRYVPQTPGIRRYLPAPANIPPPMGMQPPAGAQPQQPQQPGQQPGQPAGNSAGPAPVGSGGNPMHNPIQSFGPISASGNINGNAAFGAKNSPDSSKVSCTVTGHFARYSAGTSLDEILAELEKSAAWHDFISKPIQRQARNLLLAGALAGGALGFGGGKAINDAVHAPNAYAHNRPVASATFETAAQKRQLLLEKIKADPSIQVVRNIDEPGYKVLHTIKTVDPGKTLNDVGAVFPDGGIAPGPGKPQLTAAKPSPSILSKLLPTAGLAAGGAALGAWQAPQGHKAEGATRGAVRGGATGIGGTAGYTLGKMTKLPFADVAGAGIGGLLGYGAAGLGLGRASWEKRVQQMEARRGAGRYPMAVQARKMATEKISSPRWVRELQADKLSPENLAKITAQMEPGKARFVKNLGHGSFNLADLMAGNVGGEKGLLVRKLQLHKLTQKRMQEEARRALAASQHLEQQFPGHIAQILDDGRKGSKGIWQQYGNKDVVPGWRQGQIPSGPELWHPAMPLLARNDQQRAALESAKKTYEKFRNIGVQDIRPPNLGPGGQLIDYIYRAPGEHGAAGGSLGVITSGRVQPTDAFGRAVDGFADTQPIGLGKLREKVRNLMDVALPGKPDPDAIRRYWLGDRAPTRNTIQKFMPKMFQPKKLDVKRIGAGGGGAGGIGGGGIGGIGGGGLSAPKPGNVPPAVAGLLQRLLPVGAGAGLGAGWGALTAPKGYKAEGARRGAVSGGVGGVGSMVGKVLGGTSPAGKLLGPVVGGLAGHALGELVQGNPGWTPKNAAAQAVEKDAGMLQNVARGTMKKVVYPSIMAGNMLLGNVIPAATIGGAGYTVAKRVYDTHSNMYKTFLRLAEQAPKMAK